jgi:hypothetical protein
MYNQPTERRPNGKTVGLFYKNPIDCLWKTAKTEGILAWYKGKPDSRRRLDTLTYPSLPGSLAHILRIAPCV